MTLPSTDSNFLTVTLSSHNDVLTMTFTHLLVMHSIDRNILTMILLSYGGIICWKIWLNKQVLI